SGAITAIWLIVRRRWARDARNLEHVRPLADPAEEQTFADIAEQLLDDGLAEVCEELGWME
ncbi:hypothetical protein, partial [Pseudonocardia sp.]|uniref:hypothetical protein n=1 Tax=Pseudonocardia sp. TaxID=60912 RepID=UPI00260C570B